MTASFLAIGLGIAAATLLCYVAILRGSAVMAIAAQSSRSKKLLLKANRCPQYQDKSAQGPWRAGLTKCEAEGVLDWLEANGRRGKLSYVAGEGFTVSCKPY